MFKKILIIVVIVVISKIGFAATLVENAYKDAVAHNANRIQKGVWHSQDFDINTTIKTGKNELVANGRLCIGTSTPIINIDDHVILVDFDKGQRRCGTVISVYVSDYLPPTLCAKTELCRRCLNQKQKEGSDAGFAYMVENHVVDQLVKTGRHAWETEEKTRDGCNCNCCKKNSSCLGIAKDKIVLMQDLGK